MRMITIEPPYPIVTKTEEFALYLNFRKVTQDANAARVLSLPFVPCIGWAYILKRDKNGRYIVENDDIVGEKKYGIVFWTVRL